MNKNLSSLGLLWIALTSMIGSGWLFGALYSAHLAGPAAILAWPIAGVLLLFVALAFAEVATMFPESGSLIRLPFYTHGRLTSVMMGGLAWLSLATIPVIETQGVVQYASNYLPGLVIPLQHAAHYSISPLGYLFALVILFTFVLLNYFGIRLFARINAAFTIWKLVIPALTVIMLLTLGYHAKDFSQLGGFMPYGWHGVMGAISSGGVLFSLLGFRQAVIMMHEIENPGKYIPIILISSVLLTSVLYTALQWAFIGSLRPEDIIHGWANLSFPGDAGPFAALALIAGMTSLSMMLYIDAFISPYSTGLVYTTTAANMLSNMGSMNHAPLCLAKTNGYHIPWLSLSINFLLAACMFFLLQGWAAMASFLVAAMMISYAVGPLALVCLRRQLPTHPRPFYLKGGNTISFIGFYVCTLGVYWSGFTSVVKLLVLSAVGLILYFLYYLLQNPRVNLDGKNALWLLLYMAGLGVFSYLGNFGGNHLLPPYWDLLYLMGFNGIIFFLAIFSRKPTEYVEQIINSTSLPLDELSV